LIKWHHLQIQTKKDQAQRHGYWSFECPPTLDFLYIGHLWTFGRRDKGEIFCRFRTGSDPIFQVKSAHLLAIAWIESWRTITLRCFGTTIYNQPRVLSVDEYDDLPKTAAYVDYEALSWDRDKAYPIDITAVVREQHQLGLLTPNSWVGFVISELHKIYYSAVGCYTLTPGLTNELSLHMSDFVDLPGDDEPPPDPEIPNPPNDPILPPIFTPPAIPPNRAMVLEEGIYWGPNQAHVVAHTDQVCLMILLWTDVLPEEHKMSVERRGMIYRWDNKYCFVNWHEIPEESLIPSRYHDFCWPDWQDGNTKYYRFVFIFNSEQVLPNTPFYQDTYPGDASWLIPEDPTIPIPPPGYLTEEGLPCFGPELVLYEPYTWGGMLPPDFELFFTEVYTWLGVDPPTWFWVSTESWT